MLAYLETDQLPADLEQAIRRERQYAALKVIWEHREVGALNENRAELIEGRKNVEEFFTDVDDWAWENLQGEQDVQKNQQKSPAH